MTPERKHNINKEGEKWLYFGDVLEILSQFTFYGI